MSSNTADVYQHEDVVEATTTSHLQRRFSYLEYRRSLYRCKQPIRCNNFRLLIFLLIYLNLLYIFRATNSPIFRSTFWLYVQRWYNAPILLPTGEKVEMELHEVPSQPCHRSAAISVHCMYQRCTYSEKVLLKMGEFVARNM